jgi:hypothetical protein
MKLKNIIKKLTILRKRSIWFFAVVLFSHFLISVRAQVSDVPKPHKNEPIALDSLPEVILYIILPGILILLYIIYRIWLNRKKKEKEEEEQDPEKKP